MLTGTADICAPPVLLTPHDSFAAGLSAASDRVDVEVPHSAPIPGTGPVSSCRAGRDSFCLSAPGEGAAKLSQRDIRRGLSPAAHRNKPHEERWLLIEWPHEDEEPFHYWFSTLPSNTSIRKLVATAQGCWRIKRDYQELNPELGLHHYEGRN